MKPKMFVVLFSTALLLGVSTKDAYAHVVVKPAEVGIGQSMSFVMGVPNEKKVPTTGLRLVIPEGLTSVRPLVKPGWKIEIRKSGENDDARVTEISWTGGAIPADQKDEFVVSAKAPTQKTNLIWKAYQTYSDGSIVTWDQPPQKEGEKDDDAKGGPYSQTKVVDDLAASPMAKSDGKSMVNDSAANAASYSAYAALTVSIAALIVSMRKGK